MKATTIVGIILLALGILSFAAGGFSYKSNEKIIDAGPIQASAQTTKHVPISPILGGILLASGVVLLFMGNRKA